MDVSRNPIETAIETVLAIFNTVKLDLFPTLSNIADLLHHTRPLVAQAGQAKRRHAVWSGEQPETIPPRHPEASNLWGAGGAALRHGEAADYWKPADLCQGAKEVDPGAVEGPAA
jgi:hypothetical protein